MATFDRSPQLVPQTVNLILQPLHNPREHRNPGLISKSAAFCLDPLQALGKKSPEVRDFVNISPNTIVPGDIWVAIRICSHNGKGVAERFGAKYLGTPSISKDWVEMEWRFVSVRYGPDGSGHICSQRRC